MRETRSFETELGTDIVSAMRQGNIPLNFDANTEFLLRTQSLLASLLCCQRFILLSTPFLRFLEAGIDLNWSYSGFPNNLFEIDNMTLRTEAEVPRHGSKLP